MVAVWGMASVLLVLLLICMHRIGEWHRIESAYWGGIALLVTVEPEQDMKYRPLLEWVQANPPSLWARVRGWKSPEWRRAHS